MKKAFVVLVLLSLIYTSRAQDEKDPGDEKKGGFKKENLFTGGGLTVSFSNYSSVFGASPVLGYSIAKWLDAGIVFNFSYASDRHVVYFFFNPPPNPPTYYISDDKLRQTVLGPGVFARIYPVNFLFVQLQGEQNFISQKIIYDNGAPSKKDKVSAASFLVGAGYCNGREGKGSLFYYISIMADVAGNKNSPYVEQTETGRINMLPVIRAGLQVPLFQGRRNRY